MSEITRVPISEVLGDRNGTVNIENSWSKDVPSAVGSDAPAESEFNRTKAIIEAAKRGSRRLQGLAETPGILITSPGVGIPGKTEHFFELDMNGSLKYIVSLEFDRSKFAKDLSGRMFRDWVKKNVRPVDIENVVSFPDNALVKDVVEMMRGVE